MGLAQILLIAFIICTLVQLAFWWGLFSKLAFYKSPENTGISSQSEPKEDEKPVSIIICARNEAENLTKFLPRILSQNYRLYEVIVVNDNSTDQTEEILIQHTAICPYLRIKHIHNKYEYDSQVGKKKVLAEGIAAVSYTHLTLPTILLV